MPAPRPTPMKAALGAFVLTALLSPAPAMTQAPGAGDPFPLHPEEVQLRLAVQALPENLREGAGVLGYRSAGGELEVLRPVIGQFICILSPPGVFVVESSCYHRTLEPFMERGRELAREGVAGAARVEQRNREAEAGLFPLPDQAAALYTLRAPAEGVDPASGAFSESHSMYVIYVPFATGSSTGLSETPLPGLPWLMDAGTPRAHIMFIPSMELPEALRAAQQRGRP